MIKLPLTLLLLTVYSYISAQKTRISLFNESPLQTVALSIADNSYNIVCDSVSFEQTQTGDVFYITLIENKIVVRDKLKPLGTFNQFSLVPRSSDNSFTITPVVPKKVSRQYTDGLTITVAYNRISLINEIKTDNYIAGVVEAETGINASSEFYKAQAVLVRTYLAGHAEKHASEGFNLCDGVHCQAYNGRGTKNPSIEKATQATSGMVAMYADSIYITAAFHANCGGYTESAKNAWLNNKNYLIPTKDPFCQNSPAARWEKTIPIDTWRLYLKDHGFKNALKTAYIEFNVVNTERAQFYRIKKDSIPYKQIRSDFQLKSSFFSIAANSTDLVIKGRGYGHGVGMCQEGAMQMAKVGYTFKEILEYYFKGITIVKYD